MWCQGRVVLIWLMSRRNVGRLGKRNPHQERADRWRSNASARALRHPRKLLSRRSQLVTMSAETERAATTWNQNDHGRHFWKRTRLPGEPRGCLPGVSCREVQQLLRGVHTLRAHSDVSEHRMSALRDALRPSGSTFGSYLVDPASSHMLVSKIKPCMSKYKQSIQ